jgi:5-enolpyruvylshikimate-3-phosphate synthase
MKHSEQQVLNQSALDNPQVGDYWHEMFCPYFLIVRVKDEEYTVLSCMGGPKSYLEKRKHELNARVDNKDGTWSFDYSTSMVVDKEWIRDAVKYNSIEGFVADVVRSPKTLDTAEEWRVSECKRLREELEELSGWKYLKESV